MIYRLLITVLVLGAALCLAQTAQAQEVTLQPAVTLQVNEGLPDSNTNSDDAIDTRLSVDMDNGEFGVGGQTQVLIRFDGIAAAVPAGMSVASARIEFQTRSFSDGPVSIGPLAAPFTNATTWNSLGGGLSLTPESTLVNLADNAQAAFDVTATVQAVVAGGTDNGWGLVNASEDGWDFCSELATCDGVAATAADQPRLVIVLTTPPRPAVPVPGPQGPALVLLLLAMLSVGLVRLSRT